MKVAQLKASGRTAFESELKKIAKEHLGIDRAEMASAKNAQTTKGRRTCHVSMSSIGLSAPKCSLIMQTFVSTVSAKLLGATSLPHLVRSYAPRRGQTAPPPHGHRWLVTEAILAATAEPPHFPPLSIRERGTTYEYQDASLSGFSNPTSIAVEEARALFHEKSLKSLVSLGAGLPDLVKPGRTLRIDSAKQLMAKLHAVAKHTERVHNDVFKMVQRLVLAYLTACQVLNLLSTKLSTMNVYFRFNISQGLGELGITDIFRRQEVHDTVDNHFMSAQRKSEQARCTQALSEVREAYLV
jgi:hypothetical protein